MFVHAPDCRGRYLLRIVYGQTVDSSNSDRLIPDSDGLTSRPNRHLPTAHEGQIREELLSIFCRLNVPEIQLARRDCAPLSNNDPRKLHRCNCVRYVSLSVLIPALNVA